MSLKTPLEMFYTNTKLFSNKIYLIQPENGKEQAYTWNQVDVLVRRMASGIQALGLPTGSHIALLSKNCAEWFIADLAIMLAGHVSVPIYPSAGKDTIRYVLEHSASKAIFIGKLENSEEQIKAVPPEIITIGFPSQQVEVTKSWHSMTQYQPFENSPVPNLNDAATIIYTSGSTGNPKGVVHTYETLSFAAVGCVRNFELTSEDRMLSYLPLAHIVERVLVYAGSLYSGMQVRFLESLETFNRDIQICSPTVFASVPRLWTRFQMGILAKMPEHHLNDLLSNSEIKDSVIDKIQHQLGFTKLRLCFSGTAPISPSVISWFSRLNINISEGWGMTENCAYGTNSIPFREDKVGSIGKAFEEVAIRISDEGEIQVKSPTNMTEYYLEPEKTAETFTFDGYLKTGDKGSIDSDGYVTITGRIKDIFKTAKGKYVAPVPIESKLSANVCIEQVCVTGSNLKQPIALVVLSEIANQIDRTEVLAGLEKTLLSVNETLESHEVLDRILLLDDNWSIENDLLTPTMKVKRHVLESKYSSIINADYNEKIVNI